MMYFIELFDNNKWHYVEHANDQRYAIDIAKGVDKWLKEKYAVRVVCRASIPNENKKHALALLGRNW